AEVAQQLGGQPEVLARVGRQAFQSDRVFGDVVAQQYVGDGVGLGREIAAVRHRPGPAGYDDEWRDAIHVEFGGASGDPEVMPAEYQQALCRMHRDAQAQVIPQPPGVAHVGGRGNHWSPALPVLRAAISLIWLCTWGPKPGCERSRRPRP